VSARSSTVSASWYLFMDVPLEVVDIDIDIDIVTHNHALVLRN